MAEIISLIVKILEVIMQKYGFWKVSFTFMLYMLIWQLSNILTALRGWCF